MNTQLANILAKTTEMETVEYSLLIDGVIECPANTDSKRFFDGLLDTIIDYVEERQAMAGLGMSYSASVPVHGNKQLGKGIRQKLLKLFKAAGVITLFLLLALAFYIAIL